MPTSADPPDALVDTSVAVALAVEDHEAHQATVEAIGGRRVGLAGHAAFETFSVLTRLPAPARRSPALVARLMERTYPATRFLSAKGAAGVYRLLAAGEVTGGAVYDALVAAAAKEHACVLLTRDGRARDTYRVVGAEVELLADSRL